MPDFTEFFPWLSATFLFYNFNLIQPTNLNFKFSSISHYYISSISHYYISRAQSSCHYLSSIIKK